MKKLISRLVLPLLIIAWLSTSMFQVDETEYAIVTQFGRPVRTCMAAGLQFKWPAPFQTVLRFDNRLQVFETPARSRPSDEFLTRDKKNVVVGTFTVWRIAPDEAALQQFLETVRDTEVAEIRLADLVVSEVGAALGSAPFASLVTVNPDEWKWRELVGAITEACRRKARTGFGVEIRDFQLLHLSFPEQNRRSVFERMRAERERIASRFRAEGDKLARQIRAEAETLAATIRADAEEQSLRIIGDADAEATAIYGAAYGQDPEFYEFVRSLETYGVAFDDKTVAIFSAASRFLRPLVEFGAAVPAPHSQATPPVAAATRPAIQPDNRDPLTASN